MAIYSQLSPTATPGRPYSFSPKTAATVSHEGLFTQLSVTATPGGRHSFVAKTPAGGPAGHTGLFTQLSVVALPGSIHSFLAKTAAEVSVRPHIGAGGPPPAGMGPDNYEYYAGRRTPTPKQPKLIDVHNDDEQVLEIIISSILSGILD